MLIHIQLFLMKIRTTEELLRTNNGKGPNEIKSFKKWVRIQFKFYGTSLKGLDMVGNTARVSQGKISAPPNSNL